MTRERQAMVVQHLIRQQAHNQRMDALRAMSPEDRQAWFDRTDRILARTDAIKAQNWAQYLYLGGEATSTNVVVAALQGRYMDVFKKEVK